MLKCAFMRRFTMPTFEQQTAMYTVKLNVSSHSKEVVDGFTLTSLLEQFEANVLLKHFYLLLTQLSGSIQSIRARNYNASLSLVDFYELNSNIS